MTQVPDDVRNAAELHRQALSEFLSYLGHSDHMNRNDVKLWYQTLIRAFADIAKAASEAEQQLSIRSVKDGVLTPSQAADSARVTRQTIHARVKSASDS